MILEGVAAHTELRDHIVGVLLAFLYAEVVYLHVDSVALFQELDHVFAVISNCCFHPSSWEA